MPGSAAHSVSMGPEAGSPLRLVAGRAVVTQAEAAAIQAGYAQEQDVIDKLLTGAVVEPGPLKVTLRAKKKGGRRVYELEVE